MAIVTVQNELVKMETNLEITKVWDGLNIHTWFLSTEGQDKKVYQKMKI